MNKNQTLKLRLTVLLTILINTAFANTNSVINQAQKQRVEIIKKFSGQFDEFKKIPTLKTQQYQTYIDNLGVNTKTLSAQFIKPAPQAIVFVSFSMPDLLLQQIMQQAASYQIPVVIRGLYQNSFHATVNKIFKLVKKTNHGGVLIDPIWFYKFDIKTVPALVVRNNNNFDVIYGNLPLKKALEIIKNRGRQKVIAEDILEENNNA